MTTRYSTALSHIILGGTGLFCLVNSRRIESPFAECSFGIITLNSLLGIWRWGNPSFGARSDKVYRFTSLLQDLLALPCIATTIWLNYGYFWQLGYAHTAVMLFPFMVYLQDEYKENELLDIILGTNCTSLAAVSIIHQNYFGVAAAINYAFGHVFVKNDNGTNFDISSQDLYNYVMCFFALFALKAVLD